jgi:hypothetical protein
MSYTQFFVSVPMMLVIFVVIEYNLIEDNLWSPIFSVFGKFFAWKLFVEIEHLWYCALNHRKSIPHGVATKLLFQALFRTTAHDLSLIVGRIIDPRPGLRALSIDPFLRNSLVHHGNYNARFLKAHPHSYSMSRRSI